MSASVPRRLVVEADGGSRGNPGPAGYGAVVLDGGPGGPVLAEVAEAIGRATNNVAEYGGLLAGLRAAREIDSGASVLVRMDSKLVVEQMSGRWKVKHADMQRLWQEAREVWPRAQVRYEWIPRAQNSHADRLANEAMDAAAQGRAWAPRSVASGVATSAETLFGGGEAGAEEATDVEPDVEEELGEADVTASTAVGGAGAQPAPTRRKSYKLLTGPDTSDFCQKVSDHLDEGYVLHGPPVITPLGGGEVHCAQAVLLPEDQR
ncbi:reverse transcriptase-like protein [Pseudokineococcus sp. 1T1Z-3]|uniref:reverse transcriptase-like protein n=1 Tax=Pseudokineococcus sp. 1T1Z-3 TaxID=3132745 RepID=UPI0030A1D758